MKILISGVCGFVGSILAEGLREGFEVCGFDNLIRPGSEVNRSRLKAAGVTVLYADARSSTDVDALPEADWVIDAAALPSVLAGVDGKSISRQVIEHNLESTINLLEYCRNRKAGFTLLSTSRVYSIAALCGLPLVDRGEAFGLDDKSTNFPIGASVRGIAESFSTTAPISLYGMTKLASEQLALEYGYTFGFPVWINRCGVLAGPGQFGQAEQGIFSFWIHSWRGKCPLRYIGFDGTGHQVRDALHPRDLLPLLRSQIAEPNAQKPRICNVAGGVSNCMSLSQLSAWCTERFGPHQVERSPAPRQFDVPWLALDASLAENVWSWRPQTQLGEILEEIAHHAEAHPEWLDQCR